MFDPDVRQHLQFLPLTSSSSSASTSLVAVAAGEAGPLPDSVRAKMRKMENKIKHTEQQLAGAKRKLEAAGSNFGGNKGKKGGGKGKKGKNNDVPKMGGFPGTLPDGTRICFPFNSHAGCTSTTDCWKGKHICLRCKEPTHGLSGCKRS